MKSFTVSTHESLDFPKHQSGFTLIEVLVAISILAIGLLALASVQASGLRSSNAAYQRTQASMAAMDIADRMRANRAGVDANNYAAISGAPGAAPTSCVGTGTNCTPAQIAARDRYDWLNSLATARDLLNPEGVVACVDSDGGVDADACTDGSMHLVTIRWDSRRNGAVGTGCVATNPADKTCYQVLVQP